MFSNKIQLNLLLINRFLLVQIDYVITVSRNLCLLNDLSFSMILIVLIDSNNHVEALTRNLQTRQISTVTFYLHITSIHKLRKHVLALL